MSDSEEDDWSACIGRARRYQSLQSQLQPVSRVDAARDRPKIPGPRGRSRLHHFYIAAKMREAKSKKRLRDALQNNNTRTMQALDTLKEGYVKNNCSFKLASGRNQHKALILVRRSNGEVVRRGVPFSAMLEMAFNGIRRINDVARSYKLSPRQIRRMLRAVALSVWKSRQRLLRLCLESCERQHAALSNALVYLAWDETKHNLAISFNGEAARGGSWDVMQVAETFLLANAAQQEMVIDVDRNPALLAGTSASVLYDGLRVCPSAKPFTDFENRVLPAANVGCLMLGRDAVGANDVLVCQLLDELPDQVLADDCSCGNHRNNLCEGSTLAAIGLQLISNMYMICCMFRMGPTYLRLRLYVDNRLEQLTPSNILRCAPSSHARRMVVEAEKYLKYHFANTFHWQQRKAQTTCDALDAPSAKEAAVVEYSKALDQFFDVFNACFHMTLMHACAGHIDLNVLRAHMREAILFVLRRLPTAPSKGKWTKTGPSLDWFYLAMHAGILPSLWVGAFKDITTKSVNDDSEVARWRQLLGTRNAKGRKFVLDPLTPWLIIITMLILEPLRYLTFWFLRASSRRLRNSASFIASPPLARYVTESTSPVTRVLQHYSAMLQGTCSRLILLYQREGDTSWESFAARRPDLLVIFRRGVTTAASWAHRRHWAEMCWPKRLAIGANDEATSFEIGQVYQEFFDTDLEKLDHAFSVKVRKRITNVSDLKSEFWQSFFRRYAWMDPMSIAPVEFYHGRDNQRSHPAMGWETFSALHVNAEAHLTIESLCDGARGNVPLAEVEDSTAKAPRLRRRKVREVFRLLRIEELKTEGVIVDVTSAELQARIDRDFEDLPQDKRQALEDEVKHMPNVPWKVYKALRNQRQPVCDGFPTQAAASSSALVLSQPGSLNPPLPMSLWAASSSESLDVPSPPNINWALHKAKFMQELPTKNGLVSILAAEKEWSAATKYKCEARKKMKPYARYTADPSWPPVAAQADSKFWALKLLENLQKFCTFFQKLSELHTSMPFVLRFSIMQSSGGVAFAYGHLATGNAIAGTIQERMNFIALCDMRTEESSGKPVLQYARKDYVHVRKDRLVDDSWAEPVPTCGRFCHLTAEQMCYYVVGAASKADTIASISVEKLIVQHLLGDRFLIEGAFEKKLDLEESGSALAPIADTSHHGEDESDEDWASSVRKRQKTSNHAPNAASVNLLEAVYGGDPDDIVFALEAEIDKLCEECESESGEEMHQPPAPIATSGQAGANVEPSALDLSPDELASCRKLAITSNSTSVVEVCHALRVSEKGWKVHDEVDNKPLGEIVMTFQGRTLQMTCKRHPKCKFLLNHEDNVEATTADLIKWVAAGPYTSLPQHSTLRDSMKEIRAKRAAKLKSSSSSALGLD